MDRAKHMSGGGSVGSRPSSSSLFEMSVFVIVLNFTEGKISLTTTERLPVLSNVGGSNVAEATFKFSYWKLS
jgi:hypothetical protein